MEQEKGAKRVRHQRRKFDKVRVEEMKFIQAVLKTDNVAILGLKELNEAINNHLHGMILENRKGLRQAKNQRKFKK